MTTGQSVNLHQFGSRRNSKCACTRLKRFDRNLILTGTCYFMIIVNIDYISI